MSRKATPKVLLIILFVAIVAVSVFATPASGTIPLKAPKYGVTPADIPFKYEVYIARMLSDEELREAPEAYGAEALYGEEVVLNISTFEGSSEGSCYVGEVIFEFRKVDDAKRVYDNYRIDPSYWQWYQSEPCPIGDEGVRFFSEGISANHDNILFRIDRFVVLTRADVGLSKSGLYDIAKITEMNIRKILPSPTPTPSIPGFEVIFAVTGLLAMAYLLRRRK